MLVREQICLMKFQDVLTAILNHTWMHDWSTSKTVSISIDWVLSSSASGPLWSTWLAGFGLCGPDVQELGLVFLDYVGAGKHSGVVSHSYWKLMLVQGITGNHWFKTVILKKNSIFMNALTEYFNVKDRCLMKSPHRRFRGNCNQSPYRFLPIDIKHDDKSKERVLNTSVGLCSDIPQIRVSAHEMFIWCPYPKGTPEMKTWLWQREKY